VTDHLPECYRVEYIVSRHGYTLTAGSNGCICDRLRACEQRTEEAWSAIAGRDQYAEGYAVGLDAAREAVDLLASDMANWSSAETAAATEAAPDLTADQWMWAQRGVHRALAAIDALREERK
jgi:hypothetical protein